MIAGWTPTLRPTKFCHQCGAKIPLDSNYCQECGAKCPHTRYLDGKSGFSIEYPDLPGWAIHEKSPGRLVFVNRDTKASLVLGFIQLPNIIPDLSDTRIFHAALDDITGSYKKSHPDFELLSSNLVTNPNNDVKGVQVAYNDRISGRLWKGRHTSFFRDDKRYDVTALAEEADFDAMDREIFTPVLRSFSF